MLYMIIPFIVDRNWYDRNTVVDLKFTNNKNGYHIETTNDRNIKYLQVTTGKKYTSEMLPEHDEITYHDKPEVY